MPNWCEGNIRFRGKKKDIDSFIKNEIVYVVRKSFDDYEEVKPEAEESEYDLILSSPNGDFYFRNTKRNFIFNSIIEVHWPDAEPDEEVVVTIDNFNSAWALRDQGWADHAKKYNIDIRMIGFERGMEFSQTMTILRNGTVTDEDKHYNDWNWDCPFPNLGG